MKINLKNQNRQKIGRKQAEIVKLKMQKIKLEMKMKKKNEYFL